MANPTQAEIKAKLDAILVNTEAWSTDDPQLTECMAFVNALGIAEQNLLLEKILAALEA